MRLLCKSEPKASDFEQIYLWYYMWWNMIYAIAIRTYLTMMIQWEFLMMKSIVSGTTLRNFEIYDS